MLIIMTNKFNLFLEETDYIDFSDFEIQKTAKKLFSDCKTNTQKAEKAFLFVRDEINHSFDNNTTVITAKASDVLKFNTGICHAKANLLAALLRSQDIPCGMCFQHLTLADDDSLGYCIHCYNAVFIENKWVRLDARGNKEGINAQFSLDEPKLAFVPRTQLYDEYNFEGIYALPNKETMDMLDNSKSVQDIIDNIPERNINSPDISD